MLALPWRSCSLVHWIDREVDLPGEVGIVGLIAIVIAGQVKEDLGHAESRFWILEGEVQCLVAIYRLGNVLIGKITAQIHSIIVPVNGDRMLLGIFALWEATHQHDDVYKRTCWEVRGDIRWSVV